MPNTNFQTIHQMGQAINEVVRQATGRDAVQNIDMEHVTVAQNHYYEEVTASGSIVSFTDRVGNTLFEKLIAQIEFVQAGSGDPSPDNIRPITGWTEANIHVSPTTDAQDGTTYSIAFPAEAGTVYGGTLDVTTGLLTVDRGGAIFDGDEPWQLPNSPDVQFLPIATAFPGINVKAYEQVICSHLKMRSTILSQALLIGEACFNSANVNWLIKMGFSSVESLKAYLATSPMTVTYPLATPLTYQLTPTEIRTLLGQNNIWADTGDIEVKVKLLKELY